MIPRLRDLARSLRLGIYTGEALKDASPPPTLDGLVGVIPAFGGSQNPPEGVALRTAPQDGCQGAQAPRRGPIRYRGWVSATLGSCGLDWRVVMVPMGVSPPPPVTFPSRESQESSRASRFRKYCPVSKASADPTH
jgi:hypothetical protein